MKKISYILIPIIALSILLAPISPVFEKHDGQLAVKMEKNTVRAAGTTDQGAAATSDVKNDFKTTITTDNVTSESVDITAIIESTRDGAYWAYYNKHINWTFGTASVRLEVSDNVDFSNIIDDERPDWVTLGYSSDFWGNLEIGSITDTAGYQVILKKTFGSLNPEKTYYVRFLMEDENGEYVNISNQVATFETLEEGVGPVPQPATDITNPALPYDLGCGITNLGGCIAQILYTLWGACAWIAELAGRLLDFFIYYATNSSAYTSMFVEKGWGVIRDVANIFFIIALLYVAIKTILSLNVTNNKKLISAIILIALLINFSLFITRVVIDGSNILAKVFYNQITTVKTVNGVQIPVGAGVGGEKSISVNLVSGFDPQAIIINQTDYKNFGTGMFIFITIIMMALTLYTAYMFFTVAILFVGRVVALWLCMIFAPLAFISYTIPFEIPFHHKKWWKDLFESAFMAPIFIFFLYIIILFIQFGKEAAKIAYANTSDLSSQSIMLRIMGTIIPFAIIFLLLTRAKKMAVDYSGELGAMMSKIGGTVMGVAGGAIMGAGAFVGTSVVGGVATRVAGSETLKEMQKQKGLGGWAARMAMRTATAGTKATYDVRKTAAGGALGKATGWDFTSAKILGLGPKPGGYKGLMERRAKREEEEFENVKTKMTDAQVIDWAKKYDKRDENGQLFTNAKDLNAYRLRAFVDNIGKTSLPSSLAYSAVKVVDDNAVKWFGGHNATDVANDRYEAKYKEEREAAPDKKKFDREHNREEFVKKERDAILDPIAKKVKMGIGITAGALAGGIPGLAFGGLAGAGIGAGAGLAAVVQEHGKIIESERLATAAMTKQMKGLQNIADRLKEVTKQLDVHYERLEKGNNIIKDKDGKPVELVKGSREQGFTVDETKVETALADLAFIAKREDLKLKELVRQGAKDNDPAMIDTKNKLIENMKQTDFLKKLATAEKDVNYLNKQKYDLKKDESAIKPAVKEKGAPPEFKSPPTGKSEEGHAPAK